MAGINNILIIHPEGNYQNNPTLKAVIDLMLRQGVVIDYCRYESIDIRHPKAIHVINNSRLRRLARNIALDHLHCKALFGLLKMRHIEFTQKQYDLIIGVDRHGLIEASMISQIKDVPLVFFSFEIMYEEETSIAYKRLEREACDFVCHWFVQDEVRARDLERENGLNSANSTLLPLASRGPGTFSSDRLRDRLRVPPDKKVAMVVGSLANWTMIREIVDSVRFWPEEWVLVVHDRYGNTNLALDCNDVSRNNRVYISADAPDGVDDLGGVFSGVSAGLAFYRPDYQNRYTGTNIEHIGLSSGKISTYMRYAVPPVMNQIGIYAELAKTNKFGLVVDQPDQIGNALKSMNFSALSSNALDYYLKHLDFANFSDRVWHVLSGAAKSS